MGAITIRAGQYAGNLDELFEQRMSLLSSLMVSARHTRNGDSVVIEWDVDDYVDLIRRPDGRTGSPDVEAADEALGSINLTGTSRSVLRLFTASVVSRLIREQIAVDYMTNIVNEVCRRFTSEEKAAILDCAIRLVYSSGVYDTYYHYQRDPKCLVPHVFSGDLARGNEFFIRVDDVFLKAFEFLVENNEMALDGFIRFRLQFYLDRLSRSTYRAIDNFLLEREYDEFVRLLRYFVEIQAPRLEQVTVMRDDAGYLQLYDASGKKIDTDKLLSGSPPLCDRDLNVEDVLISLLIALSPGRVLVCLRGATLLFETLVDVFKGRIVVCDGCSTCRLHSSPC